jgi:hypothetical protein
MATIETRVIRAAEAALAARQGVSAIDVLIGMGWLTDSAVDRWRQGRTPNLELVIQVDPSKVGAALDYFRAWARGQGLRPRETAYVAGTRDQHALQFSAGGDSEIERTFRTHWLSADLSAEQREKITKESSKAPELLVIWPRKEFTCTSCADTSGGFLIMEGPGPLCMTCADLDHLVFLPAGDAALTRRAKKGSGLSAVVVRFSTSRRRYERQGILVEEPALAEAERQCLADEDARARRRDRDRERRAEQDVDLNKAMVEGILELFPSCPKGRAEEIAQHATVRGSGRVGRSAAGRALEPEAITLAVVASVRHEDTSYDDLLMAGIARDEARQQVRGEVEETLERWRGPATGLS